MFELLKWSLNFDLTTKNDIFYANIKILRPLRPIVGNEFAIGVPLCTLVSNEKSVTQLHRRQGVSGSFHPVSGKKGIA